MSRLKEIATAAIQSQSQELNNLVAYHLKYAVSLEPLEKIRIICEAYYMVCGTEQGAKILSLADMQHLNRIYLVCLSLRSSTPMDPFISIPWAFPQTAESYAMFVEPWHKGLANTISFRYTNEAKRQEKEARIYGKPQWYAFFAKTTELDLSPTSLLQLKVAFSAHAMQFLMSTYAKLGATFTRSQTWEIKTENGGEDNDGQ